MARFFHLPQPVEVPLLLVGRLGILDPFGWEEANGREFVGEFFFRNPNVSFHEEDSGYISQSEELEEEREDDHMQDLDLAPPQAEVLLRNPTPDQRAESPSPPLAADVEDPGSASVPSTAGLKRHRDNDGEEKDTSSKRPCLSSSEDNPIPSTSSGTSLGLYSYFRLPQDSESDED